MDDFHFDDDGYLCHPDGTHVTMPMTWSTKLFMRVLGWLRNLKRVE